MTAWPLIALLAVAVFRPPRVDVWWAWAAWTAVILALVVAAMAVSVR